MSQHLLQAAEAGDLSRVQELLAAGVDREARDADGATALMRAAHAGGTTSCARSSTRARTSTPRTPAAGAPLAKAVHNPDLDRGFADVVETLIEAGRTSKPRSATASVR